MNSSLKRTDRSTTASGAEWASIIISVTSELDCSLVVYFVYARKPHVCETSLLAAYDLGAPAQLLQKIYDTEAKDQSDILSFERKSGKYEAVQETLTVQTWTKGLGDERWV